MKLIDRYIFRKFIGTFFFAISLLIVVVIIFDLSENIDRFIRNNAPWQEVLLSYYVNFIPYFINLFIYLFTFIAVVFFTSKMASHTEVIAILSSGVSFWRFLVPYMMAALLLAAMSLYLSNFLIPKTNTIRREFKDKYMERLAQSAGRNIHVQVEKDTYVYVETYNIKKEIGYKFSMEKYEDDKLVYKALADIIVHDSVQENRWTMKSYTERYIDGLNERIVQGKVKDTTLLLVPSDLYKMKEYFEEMNYFELKEQIETMKLKGAEGIVNYEVEMHQRLASPAAILILTLIGAALSCRKVRGGIGMHLGLGIAIAFSYILFMQVSKVFALFGGLSPALAAWIPNILYCLLGIYFLVKAPK